MKKKFYAAMAALMVAGMATAQTVSVVGLDGNTIATYSLDQIEQIVFTPSEDDPGTPDGGSEIVVPDGYTAVEFQEGFSYEGYYFPVDQEAIAEYLDVPSVTTTYVEILLKQGDELSDNYTANAPGFWINKYGEICSWAAEDCAVYIEYYGDDGEYGFGMGQFPGTMVAGDTLELTLVMAANDEQVEFKFYCYWIEAKGVVDDVVYTASLSGTQALNLEYDTIAVNVDEAAIAAALGVDSLDEASVVLKNPDGTYEQITTANNGYWINADGSVGTWGEAYWFIEFYDGALNIGQMPEVCEAGTYTATFCFYANEKLACINVTYTVTE